MIRGKRRDRLRAVAPGIVQEDDAAVAALLFDPLENDIGARARPILGIDVLEHDEVIQSRSQSAAVRDRRTTRGWYRRCRAGGRVWSSGR